MKSKAYFSILVVVLVGTLISVGLQAQHRQGPPRPPDQAQIKQMVDKLSAALSLTEYQKTEILRLFNDHFEKMNEVMKKIGPPPEERGGKERGHDRGSRPGQKEMENLRAGFEKDVKALLNEEQQKKFDEFMKKIRPQQRRRERPGR